MTSNILTDPDSFRSGLEQRVASGLKDLGATFLYEPYWIEYVQPEKVRKYKPDFVVGNIVIEVKGRFDTADRQKHLYLKNHHGSELDIRFLFGNPHQKISKKSKTTYAMWCEKHDFKWGSLNSLEELINA